jgi:hypothetical protein
MAMMQVTVRVAWTKAVRFAFSNACVAIDAVYRPRNPEENPLYGVVAAHLETFLARQRERDRNVPGFVEREFREFLDCGVLARGFIRLRCGSCGLDRLVPFSCKNRGFCNSCGGRRMADTAAHLVDRVIPRVPVRQWGALASSCSAVPPGLRCQDRD